MNLQLGDEDRRAVDMYLDQSTSRSNDADNAASSARPAPASSEFRSRLQTIERLLTTLDQLPASDPPPDLVARTLRRIEEHDLAAKTFGPVGGAGVGATRPSV